MTDEQKELLKNAGIIEEDFESCYVTEDNQIFTPVKDKDGNIIKTGEQFYNEDYLNSSTPQPTLEQQLLETQAQLASLQEQILLNK